MHHPRSSFRENSVCALRGYADLPVKAARLRQHAEVGHCMALAAEQSGDGYNAARLTLDAMLMDARADRLSHTPFSAVLADASAARLDRDFWGASA